MKNDLSNTGRKKTASSRSGRPDVSGVSADQFPIIAIGSSAGGLGALKELFQNMPHEPGMSFIVSQHLDPTRESMMVELLSKSSDMTVVQIKDRMKVEIDHIYMIPPNAYINIENRVLHVRKPTEQRGMRMPIDVLFRSLAEDQREKAICIILSGTGNDGVLGLKSVKGNGGMAMVQDPDTAEYDGMPNSAVATGIVDYILPASEIPAHLIAFVNHYTETEKKGMEENSDSFHLNKIFSLLRSRTKVDFRVYKKSTILRRINRRICLKQLNTIADYLDILQKDPNELKALYQDLLIGVTSFFRDPEAWQEFERLVLQQVLEDREDDVPIRIWVPGCATGEEAYTLAMVTIQAMEKMKIKNRLLIFATDVNQEILDTARAGIYPAGIEQDVPQRYLEKYFNKTGNGYQIREAVRETIIFSAQNIVYDPPFSKLDIISCRNLLIYLEAEMQNKIISLFNFALNPGGYLFLGSSETIGRHHRLFSTLSKKWRIYQRTGAVGNAFQIPILADKGRGKPSQEIRQPMEIRRDTIEKIVTGKLLQRYVPSAVVVNSDNEIVYYFGDTDKYLKHPAGAPTTKLFELAREGLSTKLRNAIQKTASDLAPYSVSNIRIKRNGGYFPVRFTVFPLEDEHQKEQLFVIAFEETPSQISKELSGHSDKASDSVVEQLEYELKSTREDLQSTIEEMEASNEELKASNEEVMSMNEELQSTNEELETSKEELQSLNEELTAVNNQLQEKLLELEETNNDLKNFVASTDIATLFLDKQFMINRFTPSMNKLFNILDSDIGRPINDLTYKFQDVDLAADARKVLDSLTPFEREITTVDGETLLERVLPYRTEDDHIDGVVMAFINITGWRRAEEKTRFHANLLDKVGDAVIAIDQDGCIMYWNRLAASLYGWKADEVMGRKIMEIAPVKDDRKLATLIMDTIESRKNKSGEFLVQHRDGTKVWVSITNSPVIDDSGKLTGVVSVSHDITEQMVAQERIAESEHTFRSLAETIPDIVVRFDKDMRYRYVNPKITQYLGVKSSDFIGKTNIDLGFPREMVESVNSALEHVLQKKRSQSLEFGMLKEGALRYFRGELAPELDNEGNVRSIVGAFRDVSELNEADRLIRESEARYHSLFRNMDGGFLVFSGEEGEEDENPVLRCTVANPSFERMFGLRENRAVGMDIHALFDRLGEGFVKMLVNAFHAGVSGQFIAHDPEADRHYDIRYYKPQKDSIALIVTDVTDKIASDEKLQINERLDFLSTLAADIAQEFSGLLYTTMRNIDFLIDDSANLTDSQHHFINEMYDSVRQADDLARNIQFFAPGSVSGMGRTDIRDAIDDAVEELRKFEEHGIEIRTDVPEKKFYVDGVPEQLRHSFVNLGLNAIQAIREKNEQGNEFITFSASVESFAGSSAGIPDGEYVHIVVEDSGVGMTDELKLNAFTPFYSRTSKRAWDGHGLGLTQVYNIIVRSHRGHIELESRKGKGTRVHIYLRKYGDQA